MIVVNLSELKHFRHITHTVTLRLIFVNVAIVYKIVIYEFVICKQNEKLRFVGDTMVLNHLGFKINHISVFFVAFTRFTVAINIKLNLILLCLILQLFFFGINWLNLSINVLIECGVLNCTLNHVVNLLVLQFINYLHLVHIFKTVILSFLIREKYLVQEVDMDQLWLLTVVFWIEVAIIIVMPDPKDEPDFRDNQVDAGWRKTRSKRGHLSGMLVQTWLSNQLEHHYKTIFEVGIIWKWLFLPQ